jgi:phosphoenolpyruvate-protein phosphotransferase (PTS system enzyme I)
MLNGRRYKDRNDTESPADLMGVAASPGIARGRAVVFHRADLSYDSRPVDNPDGEIRRLEGAVERAVAELTRLKEQVLSGMGEESAHIFRSQQTMLEDESILEEMKELIRSERLPAEGAVETVYSAYLEMFASLDADDYNRERKTDLEDVQKRLLRTLLGQEEVSLAHLETDSVIVAAELYPSDTVTMRREHVAAMITERGGITSHVAILARNLGIPAAVGVADATSAIATGDRLFLDGSDGERARIHVNPEESVVSVLLERTDAYRRRQELLAREKDREAVTMDGKSVRISANIGSVEEADPARADGAGSVGLFRSEFLFMHHGGNVSEETQFRAYRQVLQSFADGFVILRTLDVGADKPVQDISIPAEENPFLGYRGVRISLDRKELLLTQLRAAFRASAFGNLKVMFPMISGPEEVHRVLAAVKEAKRQLRQEGLAFDDAAEIGVMIEVPSAVIMADEIAELVDFFSIGTNDLTQYLLAADRMNENIQSYYQPYHPAVFRAIRAVAEAAHRKGRWVGVCGELGGMAPAVPVLVGLGVDELSMSSRSIAEAVHTVRRITSSEARELADRVVGSDSEEAVRRLVHSFASDVIQNRE